MSNKNNFGVRKEMEQNIARHVRQRMASIFSAKNTSTASISTSISSTPTWQIFCKDLALMPYKVQVLQELKSTEHLHRRRFSQLIQEQSAAFLKNHFFRRSPCTLVRKRQQGKFPHLCF